MEDIIIVFIIIAVLFWYFNIKNKNKCVVINDECDDIECVVHTIETV